MFKYYLVIAHYFFLFSQAAQTVSWLCLDGDLGSAWAQCLPELLGRSRSLTLGNGEHLYMSEASLKLIVETGSVDQVSPAALLNCVS